MSPYPALLGLFACLAASGCSHIIDVAEVRPSASELKTAGVVTLTGEWTDEARDGRTIPWRAYLPAGTTGPVPVVIVSHGLGGSRDGMGYLGEALAAHGIATVHLQHEGTDAAVWQDELVFGDAKAAMIAAVTDANSAKRYDDVKYALRRLACAAKPGSGSPFSGKIDAARVGIAGHSYGAFTVLQIAGMRTPTGITPPDARIRAALALSPPEPHFDSTTDFAAITVPTFIFTGTNDAAVKLGPISNRIINYTAITRAPAWLVVLKGGDHLVYAGTATKWATDEAAAHYPEWRACITDMAVALFRAELLGDKEAGKALSKDAVTNRVGALGSVSVK